MAGIYIPSMEIPSDGQTGQIFIVGRGWAYYSLQDAINDTNRVAQVIPVPDHGRLIDADALKSDDEYFIGKMMMFGGEEVYSQSTIDRAPTIIEAEESE